MLNNQQIDQIRAEAKKLDDAVEDKDMETFLSCFAENCEIELFGIRLQGKEGLQKSIDWMYEKIDQIKFEPITIIVEGNTFFEEFYLLARLENGSEMKIKAAEVLVYENLKVTSLRLYFDRMQLGNLLAKGFFEKFLFQKMNAITLKGLI